MASTARRLPCFGFAVAQRKQDCAVFVNPDRPALSRPVPRAGFVAIHTDVEYDDGVPSLAAQTN
jgi:hypothetical protein